MKKTFQAAITAVAAAAALGAALMAPVAAQAAPNDRVRVIVAYKSDSSAAVRKAVARLGGRVLVDLEEVNAVAVSLPRAALAAVRAQRGVDYVEDDVVQKIQRLPFVPRKGLAQEAGGTQTTPYGITQVQADQIAGTPSWRPKVCIVDSGIHGTHEDLAGNTMKGKNFVASGTWNTDEGAHGSHVAGTIAALDNTVGVIGVGGKKQFDLIIAKVFDAAGSSASSIITKGINYCGRQGANVINMSLGSSGNSRTQQRALDALAAKGVLLIASAGNGGSSALNYPAALASVMSVAAHDVNFTTASFSQFNADVEISGPGVDVVSTVPPNVFLRASTTVGGTAYPVLGMEGSPLGTATGPLADFGFGDAPVAGSMTGKVCLISRGNIAFADKVLNCQTSGGVGAIIYNNAPGNFAGTLGTTVTTIQSVSASQADGAAMLAKVGQSTTVTVEPDPALYQPLSGTSMSAPHVTGVAALVWSYYPNCTAEQIRTSLKLSALDIGAPGRDDFAGAGAVQARAAFDRIATLGCGN